MNLMEFLSASKAGKVNLLYFEHRNWMFWPVRDFRSEEHEAKRSFRRGFSDVVKFWIKPI